LFLQYLPVVLSVFTIQSSCCLILFQQSSPSIGYIVSMYSTVLSSPPFVKFCSYYLVPSVGYTVSSLLLYIQSSVSVLSRVLPLFYSLGCKVHVINRQSVSPSLSSHISC
jgi:hypothetical protein